MLVLDYSSIIMIKRSVRFQLANLVWGSRAHVTLGRVAQPPEFYSRYIKGVANQNIRSSVTIQLSNHHIVFLYPRTISTALRRTLSRRTANLRYTGGRTLTVLAYSQDEI